MINSLMMESVFYLDWPQLVNSKSVSGTSYSVAQIYRHEQKVCRGQNGHWEYPRIEFLVGCWTIVPINQAVLIRKGPYCVVTGANRSVWLREDFNKNDKNGLSLPHSQLTLMHSVSPELLSFAASESVSHRNMDT